MYSSLLNAIVYFVHILLCCCFCDCFDVNSFLLLYFGVMLTVLCPVYHMVMHVLMEIFWSVYVLCMVWNVAVSSEPLPVQCTICDRRFRNLPALNGHMRLHGGYVKKVYLILCWSFWSSSL